MFVGNLDNKQGHWKIANFEIWGFQIRVCCNYRFVSLFVLFMFFPGKHHRRLNFT